MISLSEIKRNNAKVAKEKPAQKKPSIQGPWPTKKLRKLDGPLQPARLESMFDFNLRQAEAVWLLGRGWVLVNEDLVSLAGPFGGSDRLTAMWSHYKLGVPVPQSTAVITEKGWCNYLP
jgi:hypothetical protein